MNSSQPCSDKDRSVLSFSRVLWERRKTSRLSDAFPFAYLEISSWYNDHENPEEVNLSIIIRLIPASSSSIVNEPTTQNWSDVSDACSAAERTSKTFREAVLKAWLGSEQIQVKQKLPSLSFQVKVKRATYRHRWEFSESHWREWFISTWYWFVVFLLLLLWEIPSVILAIKHV